MVTVKPFGTCSQGDVEIITLTHGPFQAEILTYGGILRSLLVPDRQGNLVDVVLGHDDMEPYLTNDIYAGALIGRMANRIAGPTFPLGDVVYPLLCNEGPNQLHGGPNGFHSRLWSYTLGETWITLHRTSPHMEEGFPGNLDVDVTYTLTDQGLTLTYQATADQDTLVNLTNHSYFNLSGQSSGRMDDQVITLRADFYTPCRAGNLPTGEVRSVEGTPLDLRQPTRLGDCIANPLLADSRGFDHNFVLPAPSDVSVAHVYSPQTGIALDLYTDVPGIQLYTGGWISPRVGKQGAQYDQHQGFALEPQTFPDAVHQSHFPSPVLKVGETYTQTTQYNFSVK